MRPRKKILLIDPDEERGGIVRFVLSIHRYEVCVISRAADCPWKYADALIVAAPCDPEAVEQLYAALKIINYQVGLLALCDAKLGRPETFTDRLVIWHDFGDFTRIVATCKVITSKKRGPMKGLKRGPTSCDLIESKEAA